MRLVVSKDRLRVIQICAAFFLLYLECGVGFGSMRVPSASALLAPLLMGGVGRGVRSALPLLLVFAGVCAISALTTSANPPLLKALSSWFQTSLAMCVSLIVAARVSRFNHKVLTEAARIILILMTALTFLEFVGVTAHLSASAGEFLYPGGTGFSYYGLDQNTLQRDLALVGNRRPTVFSPEPSVAAIGLSVACLMVFLTSETRLRAAWLGVLLLMGWRVFGSPIPLGALVVMAGLQIAKRATPFGKVVRAYGLIVLALGAAMLVAPRLAKLFGGNDSIYESSEGIRLILPAINTLASWGAGNIFGAGPGAQYDLDFVASLNQFGAVQFGTNAVWLLLFYYGPVFGSLIAYVYYTQVRKATSSRASEIRMPVILLALFLGSSLGALESPRFFGLLGMLVALVAHDARSMRASHHEQVPASSRLSE